MLPSSRYTSKEPYPLKTAMCRTSSHAPARIYHARTTLLRLQSVVAKHNARIRMRYPQSHPVRAAVEKHVLSQRLPALVADSVMCYLV